MKKLFAVVFILVALPLFGALSIHSRHRAQAFNAVPIAGHTQFGGSCGCGEPGCICDPVERGGNRNTVKPAPVSGNLDASSLMLLLFALALAAHFAMRR
jgi:hypothetical protein